MNFFYNLIAKFFFIGNSKYMPGTIASFVGFIIWVFIPESYYIRIILIMLTWIIGHYAIDHILHNSYESDPPSIVIDEIVGVWISCFFVINDFLLLLVAFVLFRIFDIIKPSFIYHIQRVSGTWGVMLDDVLSGILTSIIVVSI